MDKKIGMGIGGGIIILIVVLWALSGSSQESTNTGTDTTPGTKSGADVTPNTPTVTCALSDRDCFVLYNTNMRECKDSTIDIDFGSGEYIVDISGVHSDTCTYTIRFIRLPALSSLENKELVCNIPTSMLPTLNFPDLMGTVGADDTYCTGEAHEILRTVYNQ